MPISSSKQGQKHGGAGGWASGMGPPAGQSQLAWGAPSSAASGGLHGFLGGQSGIANQQKLAQYPQLAQSRQAWMDSQRPQQPGPVQPPGGMAGYLGLPKSPPQPGPMAPRAPVAPLRPEIGLSVAPPHLNLQSGNFAPGELDRLRAQQSAPVPQPIAGPMTAPAGPASAPWPVRQLPDPEEMRAAQARERLASWVSQMRARGLNPSTADIVNATAQFQNGQLTPYMDLLPRRGFPVPGR